MFCNSLPSPNRVGKIRLDQLWPIFRDFTPLNNAFSNTRLFQIRIDIVQVSPIQFRPPEKKSL